MKRLLNKVFIGLLILCLSSPPALDEIDARAVIELRATGSNANSGGFNPSNGSPGTDFTLQDAAQDSGTDLACADGDAAAPVVTSATHNFVAADNGNTIYITAGAGWTVGYYEIVSTAANAATLDRAVGNDGALSGGTWAYGGARGVPTDAFFEQLIAGNKVWFETGTYTMTESVDVAKDGAVNAILQTEGYKASRGDMPTGTDRPSNG